MRFQLKELREQAGWSQKQLSEKLGISQALYSGLETNSRRMNATYLEKLAELYDVRPENLIANERSRESVLENLSDQMQHLSYDDLLILENLAERFSTK